MKTKSYLLILFIAMVAINFTLSVNASVYDEIYENDFIDGSKDSFYSKLTDNIYFAYSNDRYAFYFEYTETITSIQINGTKIEGNQTQRDIYALFLGNVCEMAIIRSVFGDNVAFEISINQNTPELVDPFGVLVPPPPVEQPEGVDLVAFFSNLFSSWIFWMVLSFLFIFIADYNNHPVVKIENIYGKMVRLGRFITEVDEPRLNKKKLLFLNEKGVQEIYSNFSFRALDTFNFQHVYVIEWDYPHLLMSKLKVPANSGITLNTVNKKTLKTKFLWIFFTIFRFTPFRFITIGIYNRMDFNEKKTQDVDHIIPFICMNALEYRFDVTYEIEKLNPELNVMEYVKEEKKNILWADILTIERQNIRNLVKTFREVKDITYPSLKEAQEDKHSRFEIVNAYENRTTELEVKNMELESRLQNAYSTNQTLKLEMDQKVRDGLRPMEETNEFLRRVLPNALSNALKFRAMGTSELKAIEQSILKEVAKMDTEKDQLRDEIAKLQAQKSRDKNQKRPYNPNEIVITNSSTGNDESE